jgi:hypothetical protein
MISCGQRLEHAGRPVRVETGQQHGGLHLGARDVRLEDDRLDGGGAVNGQRRRTGVRRDAGAHALERNDDPAHRPAAQRLVAGDRGGEPVCGQGAGHHPHRAAGITGIESRRGGRPATEPATGDAQLQAGVVLPHGFDLHPEGAQAVEG